ncbi:E7 [Canis familiaris papillomavirus 2]|uniref:Protein E7 n=1 Tax=Canis familiaris papillomavirus 2 TaxID=292792 RepID=Q647I0_9PAPI|nr:E7 [Canis familiaris papillomavirus 2]AAU21226.1 E7 [Canis familiaris papillomavirus 2]UVN22515.1 CPV2 gp2 [Canis familiaris papillomavirus 2]BBC43192.1 E7 protein [Canis familiaris papillomavirus 2]
MRGSSPIIRDIDLELEELVLPANLLSGETLETEEEELQREPGRYRVVTLCNICHSSLRLFVEVADESLIRLFQQLLLDGLGIICATCHKEHFSDGRRR